jgi:methylated-DNA-[protein]-cysteine S-methyltransferase
MEPLSRTSFDTPVGRLTVVASAAGVRAVLWPDDDPRRVPLPDDAGAVDGDDAAEAQRVLSDAVAQLREYFAGTRRQFDLPLDPAGTPFQLQVWEVLRTIPFGATLSYGEQAERLGDRNKARAVGSANGRNPISIVVPCHRVVGTSGALTGFAGGVDAKRWLLQHERGEQPLPL